MDRMNKVFLFFFVLVFILGLAFSIWVITNQNLPIWAKVLLLK